MNGMIQALQGPSICENEKEPMNVPVMKSPNFQEGGRDAAEIRAHKGQSGSDVREIYRVKGVNRTVVLVIDVP
jgi:hypothetical protein